MPKNINLTFQQAFAINPEGVRFCPRGICRRTRRCLPPPTDEATYRCPVLPDEVWVRQRREILEMLRRAYSQRGAARIEGKEKAPKTASAGGCCGATRDNLA